MADGEANLRVVLLEDSAPVRRRLKELLLEQPPVQSVAEAASVQEAMRALENEAPDVLIVDIDLPDGTGMDVLRHLRRRHLRTVAVVLTNYDTPEFRLCCQALGARHYLVKSTEFERVPAVLKELQAQLP